MKEPVVYDVPEGAHVGGTPVRRGAMTIDEIVVEINASPSQHAVVVDRERGVVQVGPAPSVGEPLYAGTWANPKPFVVGRSRLYRDPNDKLADSPTARRHHHAGAGEAAGEGGRAVAPRRTANARRHVDAPLSGAYRSTS